MHGCEVVVQRQCLDKRIVFAERRRCLLSQLVHGRITLGTAWHATVPRRPEGHVLVHSSQPARLAVIIVATRYDDAV